MARGRVVVGIVTRGRWRRTFGSAQIAWCGRGKEGRVKKEGVGPFHASLSLTPNGPNHLTPANLSESLSQTELMLHALNVGSRQI